VRTQDLALAAKPGSRLTTFANVGAVALICADMSAARSWVWGMLADLALDDEPTLGYVKRCRYSCRPVATPAPPNASYCTRTACNIASARPRTPWAAPISDRGADLELALRACQYLGQAILRPVPGMIRIATCYAGRHRHQGDQAWGSVRQPLRHRSPPLSVFTNLS
jgi:hypothetical protein